jgi:hypothetical protein
MEVIPFESGHARAVWAKVFLGCGILLACISAVSSWMQISILQQAKLGQATEEALMMNDLREGLIGLAEFGVVIASAVFFLMWFHRVYRNLPALGAAGLKFTPAWAVGYWFIPFLNLVRPVQAASEIWRASDPGLNEAWGTAWQRRGGSALVGFWWAFWLISNIVDNITMRLSMRTESIDALLGNSWMYIAALVLSIVAAVLAFQLITAIDRRQEEKYELRSRLGQPVDAELTPI